MATKLCIGDQGHDPSSAQKAWYQVHTWPRSDRSEEIKHPKKVKAGLWLTSKGTSPPQAEGPGGAIGVKGLRTANQKRSDVAEHLGSERWAGGGLRSIIWSLTSVSSSKIHFPWRTVRKVKYCGTGFEYLLCARHNSKYVQPLNHPILSANLRQVLLSSFYMGRDWGTKG